MKVLILGSGALKIGEAGEFDYSGSQAIKAFKEEGVTTVLVNPNIATIQTSEALADQIYFLPVTPQFVEQVIERERPDAIALGFGGQTALNCGLQLAATGCWRDTTSKSSAPRSPPSWQRKTARFSATSWPRSVWISHAVAPRPRWTKPCRLARKSAIPVMARVAYALGGLGSGLCADEAQLRERVSKGLAHSPQVLIEEYLVGWKELEYEVVRDRFDNCIVVCNMENLDPMGIHTGESIVVAPSQTLTNREYHLLREIAIRTVRQLGVVGECNIQYALDPKSGAYRVIEVNARLSRSSALASKATGYPLAFVAAKLGLGHALTELPNAITGVTKACFEPALDYVVVKAPRWDLQKFRGALPGIGSSMKSVGEVMAIGRSFEEALQKALRMLSAPRRRRSATSRKRCASPPPSASTACWKRCAAAMSVDRDPCAFAHRPLVPAAAVANIVRIERHSGPGRSKTRRILGCADRQIVGKNTPNRCAPSAKRPASCRASSRSTRSPASIRRRPIILYLTYNGTEDDVAAGSLENAVLVLGSGAYRIGSSVEFDWCAVNTVQSLRRMGYRTIMLNHNPETVSTDYNECDRLYFDEISLETVLDLCRRERPLGVVVSVGGQLPNNLALELAAAGVPLLGTSAESIDTAEDRHKFSRLLDSLGIAQPAWRELSSSEDALEFARRVGYPVLVRPSYVLVGRGDGRRLERRRADPVPEQGDHPVAAPPGGDQQVPRERAASWRWTRWRATGCWWRARCPSTSRTPACIRGTPRWCCRRSAPTWRPCAASAASRRASPRR